MVSSAALAPLALNRDTLLALADVLALTADVPRERLVNAVKEEVADQLRAVITPHIASFFFSTREFTERSVRRIVDTVTLFANMIEWGLDSARGRFCLERVNEIHGRYALPGDGMRFVLSGILFIPME